MKTKLRLLLTLLSLCTLHSALTTVMAQGTAFTYQGQLVASGVPANGNFDFVFELYNVAANGSQQGAALTNLGVAVANGLFVVTNDFGNGPWTGQPLWMQLQVRTNNGGTFTSLSPRQAVTSTPYAIQSLYASNADSVAAVNITGTILLGQLPGAVITNGEASVTLSNAALSGSLSVPGSIYSGGSLLLHSDANQNFFSGTSAGGATTSGQYNTANGYQALYTNTSGSYNTADGNQALYSNNGAGNTAVGAGALSLNTSGGNNIALGYQAGFNITGSGNIDIGNEGLAGENNIIRIGSGQTTSYIAGVMLHSDANQNFFTGTSTGSATTSGQYNTANGYQALYTNTSGSYNTADGNQTLYNNTGTGNTAVGAGALLLNAAGGNNIAVGYQAGFNITGSENIDIGNEGLAADVNTIRIGTPGVQTNTYIAGVINSPALTNATLNNATFNGTLSGIINGATLANATLNGSLSVPGSIYSGGSLLLHADANQNFFTGTSTGSATTSGQYNTATGYQALYTNTSGSYNTADGNQALYNNTGTGNTAVGAGALLLNTAGGNNIALGYQAGFNVTGGENIDIGNEGFASENNTIRIGTPGVQTSTYIAGVITGNGGGLTNLASANLTGTLPALNGSNLTNLNVSTSELTSYGNANSAQGGNFFVGNNAGNATTSGSDNIALGNEALWQNSTGSDNTAIGNFALEFNTSGSANTALGFYALNFNGSGSNNIGLGYDAGLYIGSGSSNIDIGNEGFAADANIIRIGSNQTTAYIAGVITGNGGGLTNLNVNAAQLAGNSNQNIFVGPSGNPRASGSDNTALGSGAFDDYYYQYDPGLFSSTGSANTALGAGTLFFDSSGSSNTAVGVNALYVNTIGNFNTAVGNSALLNLGLNNYSVGDGGSNNIALGCLAGSNYMGNESSNIVIGNAGVLGDNYTIRIGTTGIQTNTFIAGVINGNGGGLTNLNVNAAQLAGNSNQNIFVGPSGNPRASGSDNTALGSGAFDDYYYQYDPGLFSSTGSANTALGAGTLFFDSSGSSNTAVGVNALYVNTIGNFNTAVGNSALLNLGLNNYSVGDGGSNNIALGCLAGSNYMGNESSNIVIGNTGVLGDNYTIRIGTPGVQTNTFIAGVINGNGGGLTSLTAANIASGGTLPSLIGVNLTSLNAANITPGGTLPALNGASLTSLNASQLTSGSIQTSVLPGFQSSSNYSTIDSGQNNTVSGSTYSVIGGGTNNVLTNVDGSAIVGGLDNTNNGNQSTIGGGAGNVIQVGAYYSFLGSGGGNVIQTNADATVLGGGYHNLIASNAAGSFLGGGQYNAISNNATFSVLGGGYGNTNSGNYATVTGGYLNLANNSYATVSGYENQATGISAVVAGGSNNIAGGGNCNISGGANNQVTQLGGAIGGGYFNTNTATYATIPGGYKNLAGGSYAFAAGENAQANNNNSFVWSDGSATTTSSANGQFLVRASGGVTFYTSSGNTDGAALAANGSSWGSPSDRNVKKNFQPVDTKAVLAKLASIPIQQWNYKWEKDGDVPNIGPMAQDFKGAFYPGRDDKSITTLEFDGVELAAIQGLNQKLEAETKEKDAEIQDLKQSVADLKKMVQALVAKK